MRTARRIVLAWLVAGGALFPAGCGPEKREDLPEAGEILKISYFRAYPDPRTKQLEASYRVVMSNSWKDRVGESPRDPLVRAAPRKLYVGFLTDHEMAKYLRLLREFGIERLISRDTEQLKPDEQNRLALDPKETSYTRIITVATDKWQKSYLYRDQHFAPGAEQLIPVFTKCEAFVARIVEYSIQTRVYTDRAAIPTDR